MQTITIITTQSESVVTHQTQGLVFVSMQHPEALVFLRWILGVFILHDFREF